MMPFKHNRSWFELRYVLDEWLFPGPLCSPLLRAMDADLHQHDSVGGTGVSGIKVAGYWFQDCCRFLKYISLRVVLNSFQDP